MPAHAPFSDEQGKLTRDGFYARMGKLINPQGLDAEAAYRETLDALAEQLTVRVGSVDNGEKFMRENKNPVVIPCPTAPRSSRPPARGRTTRPRRATCGCSSR